MNYIIEANLGLLFFYGVYFLLLRNETDFRNQRIFLLSGLVCSLVFPFVQFERVFNGAILPGDTLLPELFVGSTAVETGNVSQVFSFVYLGVAVALACPLLFQIVKLYRSLRLAGTHHGKYYIIESNSDAPSWSFFRVIFVGRADTLSPDEKDLIIRHEMLHGRLFHSADMLFITVLCLVCWFNPVLWIYRRTLARVHEFEVDAIVGDESSPAEYGILLAKTALSGNGFLLAHHFNQSFILKRINMLNALKRRLSNWKIVALAATIGLYFAVVSCTDLSSEKNEKSDEVYTIVDDTAVPADGMTSFYADIANSLRYPEDARKKGIEGKVFVGFTVNTDGTLTDFKILKGIGGGCDDEALHVMSLMKPWKPAKMKGKTVRQNMVLPITFNLN